MNSVTSVEVSGHTPGPWMIYETGDIASACVRTPEHTVIKSGTVKGATIGEAMANARLIAAAPEMLEALQYIANGGLAGGTDGKRLKDAQYLARRAIAKAEGCE